MYTAHRYFLVEWSEKDEPMEHRFSMAGSADAFVLFMTDQGIEVKLTKINGRV